MPRLLHIADVHLGARHHDLGAAAAAQRERQFAAFKRAVDLAIEEKVDALLICGDLFDSNYQPRRSVERAAAELRRLAERHIYAVLIPGTHDAYDESSIYRVFDLPALAAGKNGPDGRVVVLTDERPMATFAELDLTVHARIFRTKRAPASPLAGFAAGATGAATRWQVAMIHGARLVPGVVEDDDVLFTDAEIAASGLDYLALGHWHSQSQGRAGKTTWAYSGAPEPIAVDQAGAGSALLVTLDEQAGVRVEARPIGRTRMQRLDIDAAGVAAQADLVAQLSALADADLVLDARLVGVLPDALDLDLDEIERQLAGQFLRLRLRDRSVAALPAGELPPAETIPGAFVRDLEKRIAEREAAGEADSAAELREALRLGRLLLDEPHRVTLG